MKDRTKQSTPQKLTERMAESDWTVFPALKMTRISHAESPNSKKRVFKPKYEHRSLLLI